VVNADTSGFQSIKKVEVNLDDKNIPPGAGGH